MNHQGIDATNFNTETSIWRLVVYWSVGDFFPKTYGPLEDRQQEILSSNKQETKWRWLMSQQSPTAARQYLPHLSMPCSKSDITTFLGPYDTISTSNLNVFDQMETRNVENNSEMNIGAWWYHQQQHLQSCSLNLVFLKPWHSIYIFLNRVFCIFVSVSLTNVLRYICLCHRKHRMIALKNAWKHNWFTYFTVPRDWLYTTESLSAHAHLY